MVDGDDVLRSPATKKVLDGVFKQRLVEFRRAATAYNLPEKTDLERAVEERETCAKCKGGVRAVLEAVQPWDGGVTADLEILVALTCRDQGECRWSVKQWRPWRKNKPLDL